MWHGGGAPHAALLELRSVVAAARVLEAAPDSVDELEWEAWAAGTMPHVERLLAACGALYRDGQWTGITDLPERTARSRHQSLPDMVSELTAKQGEGDLGALMVDFDDDGKPVPCMTHDGLVRHVMAKLADWSSDKSTGPSAYALTAAFTASLFEEYTDRRGMRRAMTRARDEAVLRANQHANQLEGVSSTCTALQETGNTTTERLTAAQADARVQHMNSTVDERAAAVYYSLTGELPASSAATSRAGAPPPTR